MLLRDGKTMTIRFALPSVRSRHAFSLNFSRLGMSIFALPSRSPVGIHLGGPQFGVTYTVLRSGASRIPVGESHVRGPRPGRTYDVVQTNFSPFCSREISDEVSRQPHPHTPASFPTAVAVLQRQPESQFPLREIRFATTGHRWRIRAIPSCPS